MNKEYMTKERFLLSLVAVHTKDILNLDNNINISIEDYGFDQDKIRRKVTIDFPSIESWGKAVNMWASWKRAYKHRKR